MQMDHYQFFHEYKFKLEKKNNQIFIWNNGTLISEKQGDSEEFCYVHFQKRNLEICKDLGVCFKIVPNKITNINDEYKKNQLLYKPFFQLKWKALKKKIRR